MLLFLDKKERSFDRRHFVFSIITHNSGYALFIDHCFIMANLPLIKKVQGTIYLNEQIIFMVNCP